MLKKIILLGASLTLLMLFNRYVETVYQYSLIDYWQWLFLPSDYNYFEFDEFVVSLVLILTCLFWFSLFINGMLVKLMGKEHQYIYLGNSKKFYGHYFAEKDLNKKIRRAVSETEYCTSFDDIGRLQLFIHQNSSTDIGKASQQFSFGNLFANLIIMMLFFIPLMGTLHACFAAMSADLFVSDGSKNVFAYEWNHSFEMILLPIGLSLGKLFGWWVFTLCLMFFFLSKYPRQAFGKRYLPLPNGIHSGAKFNVLPIEIDVVFANRTVIEYGVKKSRYLETSKRNITFEFTKLYKWPVYVTAIVDLNGKVELEQLIKQKIETKQRMDVILDQSLKPIFQ